MSKILLTIKLVWKQPLWILDKYKYGLIIKVLGKEFKLLVSRKIPKEELEKRKQLVSSMLPIFQRESQNWFEVTSKTYQSTQCDLRTDMSSCQPHESTRCYTCGKWTDTKCK